MTTWKNVETSKTHRLFYPQVPVLVTVEFEARIGGMPAIWCMPLSFTPPLIGVAVAPEHETYKMLIGAGAFGINWLEFKYAKEIARLGQMSAKQSMDKLSSVGLTPIKETKTSQPLIGQASAILECKLAERHRFGTHELVVGEVLRASSNDYFDGEYWDFSNYNALLYAGTKATETQSWVFISTRGEIVTIPYGNAE